MSKESTQSSTQSSASWEHLETFARGHIQEFIQRLLEQEVEELLGRAKSERREPDAPLVYRNGHGKPRKLALSNGTITVKRPRVRGLEERFESRLLPLFKRRTEEVAAMLPDLYLHEGGQRESRESWAGVLRDLAARGLDAPHLMVADGHLGLWAALAAIWPQCAEQRCWNHKMMNVLDQVPRKRQAAVRQHLRTMMYAETRTECAHARDRFVKQFRGHTPRRPRRCCATGTEWSPSSIFRRSTGRICARRTLSSHRSHRCGCARPRRSATSAWRMRRHSSGSYCVSRRRRSGV